jgi:hypothetical protein
MQVLKLAIKCFIQSYYSDTIPLFPLSVKNGNDDFEVLNQPIRSYEDYMSPILMPCKILGSELTALPPSDWS